MKDSQALQKERDMLHKNLVHEACHKSFIVHNTSDGVLQLHNPFYIKVNGVTLLLVGIDCDFGCPVAETYSGDFREVRYSNLTIDELVTLHSDVVMNKLYTFTPTTQLV
jgi:hypothetical protein